MRTLLVIGTGLLGTRIARGAARHGWSVAAVDRDPGSLAAAAPWATAGTAVVDVTDTLTAHGVLAEFAPHTIVHTASPTTPSPDPAHRAAQLRGYANGVASAAAAAVAAHARRLVLLSSLAVYDLGSLTGPVPETTPPSPRSLYGQGKHLEEAVAVRLLHGSGIELSVLRPVGFYGPGRGGGRMHRALHELSADARSGRPVRVAATLQGREYLHVGDAARATLLAAAPEHPPGTYNIGTGFLVTGELIVRILAAAGHRATAEPAVGTSPLLDVRQAREHLGFQPAVSFAAGLAEILAGPAGTVSGETREGSQQ